MMGTNGSHNGAKPRYVRLMETTFYGDYQKIPRSVRSNTIPPIRLCIIRRTGVRAIRTWS